jgi:hypothetical protein
LKEAVPPPSPQNPPQAPARQAARRKCHVLESVIGFFLGCVENPVAQQIENMHVPGRAIENLVFLPEPFHRPCEILFLSLGKGEFPHAISLGGLSSLQHLSKIGAFLRAAFRLTVQAALKFFRRLADVLFELVESLPLFGKFLLLHLQQVESVFDMSLAVSSFRHLPEALLYLFQRHAEFDKPPDED